MRAGIIGAAVLLTAVLLAQDGQRVAGTVVDSVRKSPVVNATVLYVETGGAAQTTKTDSKGRFEIPHGVEGVVTVTARRYATAKRTWPPREGREFRFELHPPSTVSGTLMDMATGAAVYGLVTVYVRHSLNLVTDTAVTREGAFQFDDLPPGPAEIVAHADGFAPYFGTLTLDRGEDENVRAGLLLEAVASGLVVDRNDDPVNGARIRAGYDRTLPGSGHFAGLARGHAKTESDGMFELGGLVPDTPVALQAEVDGQWSDPITVTVGPGMAQRGLVLRLP